MFPICLNPTFLVNVYVPGPYLLPKEPECMSVWNGLGIRIFLQAPSMILMGIKV